jgi:WD40 repeat protein
MTLGDPGTHDGGHRHGHGAGGADGDGDGDDDLDVLGGHKATDATGGGGGTGGTGGTGGGSGSNNNNNNDGAGGAGGDADAKAAAAAEAARKIAAEENDGARSGQRYGSVVTGGEIDVHGGWVTAIAFSTDSHKLVSGCADGVARTFSLQWGSFLLALEGHQAAVTSVAWVQKRIVTGSDDKTVRAWNAENGQLLHLVEGQTGPVLAVAMHPNARFIASGGESQLVALVDSLKKQNIVVQRTMLGHRKAVTACAILDDAPALGGRELVVVSVSRDNLVAVWDGNTCDMLTSFNCETPRRDGDGTPVAPTGSGMAPESLHAGEPRSYVTAIDISPDGSSLVTGSTDMQLSGFVLFCLFDCLRRKINKKTKEALPPHHAVFLCGT